MGGGTEWRRKKRLGRAETFRRRHQVGDQVSGFILEWIGQGLAWVEVDGHRLLARTEFGGNLGDPVSFRIMALSPEIVLRPVREDSPHSLSIRV